MAKKPLPCPTVLRQLLRYEPETGKLFWKHRGPAWFSSKRGEGIFRGQFENQEALACVHTEGYRYGRIFGAKVFAHRVIWKFAYGHDPNFIDHINGDRADNRLENLRSVQRADNQKNLRLQKRNKTGIHGVYKVRNRWIARIRHKGKEIALGSFASVEEAKSARKAAEVEYGFHPNHGK